MKRNRRKLSAETLESRRLLASGNLDTTFGIQGRTTTEFRESSAWGRTAYATVVQPDGKIVTAGEGAVVRYQEDGKLDPTFGIEGRVAFPYFARSIALGDNNKIVVVGGTSEFNSTDFAIAQYDSTGALDPTFDGDGLATVRFSGTNTFANDVAVQANGRIVVAGTSENQIAAARLLPTGALDTSFDGDGRMLRRIGVSDTVSQVAIQPNGRIVIAGNTTVAASFGTSVFVMRLHPGGSLDGTLQGTGYSVTSIAPSSAFNVTRDLALQPDGKIVVSTYSRFSFNDYVALVRFNQDGSLDSTWDNDGILLQSIFVFGNSGFVGNGVVVQPDGMIVTQAIGRLYRYQSNGTLDPTFDSDGIASIPGSGRSIVRQSNGALLIPGKYNELFAVARINPDGSLDNTFSGDGVALTDLGPTIDQASATTLQSDGKILVLGTSSQQFGIARYLSNGTLDNSFSQDGKATVSFGDEFWSTHAKDIAVQADGKILVVGTVRKFQNPVMSEAMAVARLNADGSLDSTFSGDGLLVMGTTGNATANAIALQSDGRIIISGRRDEAFAVTRLLSNGELDLSFSSDGWNSLPSVSARSEAMDVVVQTDGRILVVGNHSPYSPGRFPSSLMMARFNSNGALDTTFGTNGRRIETSFFQRTGEQVQVLADGSFLIVGNALTASNFSTISTMVVTKFNRDGSLATSFGTLGALQIPWQFVFSGDFSASSTSSFARGLLVQADGKIVVTGELNGQFAIARAFPDGVLDTSFSGDGRATFTLSNGSGTAIDAIQQSNGQIIVVGSNRSTTFASPDSDFELMRLVEVNVPATSTIVRLNAVGYIEMADQWSRDDQWEIRRLDDQLVIREVSGDPKVAISIAGLPGVTSISNNEFSIPISTITTTGLPFLIQGRGGDDSLTRIGNDFIVPPTGLNFFGGEGRDRLSQLGTTLTSSWEMNSDGTGVLKSDGQPWTRFSFVEHFVGGVGTDTFRVATSGAIPTQLRFEGGESTGIDTLQVTGNVDMLMPSDFLPLNQYRLNVVGSTNQRLSMRGIEQLGLTGGPGNNRIDVSRFQGVSSLFGGAGNDFLVSSSGSSLLEGQDGDDQLFGSFGNDTLRGGNGNDLLMGDSGNDLLEGGAGRDIVMGGSGTDQLYGGTGDDILLGGHALELLRDANAANRNSILARWANASTYAERTTDLLQGLNGPGLIPNINVFSDSAADSFFGEAGRDWFFASESQVDPVTGRVGDSIAGELVTKFS